MRVPSYICGMNKQLLVAALVLATAASAQTTSWNSTTAAPASTSAEIAPDGTVAFAWSASNRARVAVTTPDGTVWGRSFGEIGYDFRAEGVHVVGQSVWVLGTGRQINTGNDSTHALVIRSYPALDTAVAFNQETFNGVMSTTIARSVDGALVLPDGTVRLFGHRSYGAAHYPMRWDDGASWTDPSQYGSTSLPIDNPSPLVNGSHVRLTRYLAVGAVVWSVGSWSDEASSHMYFHTGSAGVGYPTTWSGGRGSLTEVASVSGGYVLAGWSGQVGSEVGILLSGSDPSAPTTRVSVSAVQLPVVLLSLSQDGVWASGTRGDLPLLYNVSTHEAWEFPEIGEALRVYVVGGEPVVATRLGDGSLRVDRGISSISSCWSSVDVVTSPIDLPGYPLYGGHIYDEEPSTTYAGGIFDQQRINDGVTVHAPELCSTGIETHSPARVVSGDVELGGISRATLTDARGQVVWSWQGAGMVTVPLSSLTPSTYYLVTDVGASRFVVVR